MGVLDDKVAIVTGSARGIGRATAELLSEHGAKLIINDLDADLAEQAASEIAGETAVYGGDLTKDGSPEALVQTAIDAFGKIDIIVNNAGYTIDAPIHKMSDDAFQRMLDIHTVVPFRVIRAAAPHLREPAKAEREQGVEVFRKIVNVSSISGTMGNAGQANYASGKAAVVGLTKTLAKEWGQFKINVNAVAFGWIETRLTATKDADNTMEIDGQTGAARHPRADAHDGPDADPDRPPGHAGGGRRRRVLPLLAVVELRPRPGAQRHRRPVHGDDDMKLVKPSGEERDVPRGVVGGAEISQATTGAHNLYMGIFRVPAGARGRPHYHDNCESALYMLSGSIEIRFGDQLEESLIVEAGDMLYVPPRETHTVTNTSDSEPAEYVVARDSPTEDSVEVPWADRPVAK